MILFWVAAMLGHGFLHFPMEQPISLLLFLLDTQDNLAGDLAQQQYGLVLAMHLSDQ